ncbi:MAG TPA: pantoate--beta-alanine ligase [Acidimicrobiales bacterium]|nr:pantoate--beta-alanine ligase [Acidimicrobiales bacterium]
MTTVVRSIADLRATLDAARRDGRAIGFVPTMGYLHDGHRSLMRAAAAANDTTVVSVFVNPLQFAPTEDLDRYPSDFERDVQMASDEGMRYVFAPSQNEMYPERMMTSVSVAGVSEPLEGASRPSHFAGVATVVTKLLSIVGPCRSYFGEKDFQQLAVIRRLVFDLSLPIDVVACPTVRETDGLAMSSRNVNLTPDARRAAPVLLRALQAGRDAIAQGERDALHVRRAMRKVIEQEPLIELDYAEVVDESSFVIPSPLAGTLRLLIAARLPNARLIDNIGADVP